MKAVFYRVKGSAIQGRRALTGAAVALSLLAGGTAVAATEVSDTVKSGGGSASPTTAAGDTLYTFVIVSPGSNGSPDCPVYVTNFSVTIDRNDSPRKLAWAPKVLDPNSPTGFSPFDLDFNVIFDPFEGPTALETMTTPAYTKRTVNPIVFGSIPDNDIDYKYTLYTDGCDPIDPYVRIR
ncbi:hypothetical protein E4634_17205 [Mangrovimicrobium sediminis]|uniref:Uncharacterized protein n=1 Tax=Mangrovimicrobium sediminis TaxID=2562682 RepID=A0A4Z0LX41_9GAMM|nr:hypothetical protein [Haliea sp. SAOS-164]TGD71851.1 hypothetical protein E4634_17205 [Haliea sp. SAOS-164]